MAKNYVTSFRGENFYTPTSRMHIKDEPVTPQEEFGNHNDLDYSIKFENEHGSMRKSLSMNDIAALREDLLGLEVTGNEDEVYQRYKRPTGAPQELSRTKFVSMAEAIYHYQRDTPGRFHSTKRQTFRPQGFAALNGRSQGVGPSGLTIPQSPMLRCRSRSRPVHIMSQKEKEELELEELKKFKIKANPIPKSVIEGTKNLPEVPRRPPTVPEPFKLTEVQKKQMDSPEHIQFKARPAPKHILEKPHIPPKPPVQVTKPKSPKFNYKRAKSEDKLTSAKDLRCPMPDTKQKSAEKLSTKSQPRHGPVKPMPFSFEKRDEEMKKKREERIKKQIEEERKQASQFRAQPLPGVVRKQMHAATVKCSSSTSSENKENHIKFEARPPTVLYKQPFKPVHQTQHVVKMAPFQLTTEKRAVEREKFDKLLKEKEEEQEKNRLQREKELQEAEEKANLELRAKLVHQAKPVPVAIQNPYTLEKSVVPLTVPETPKFVRRLKNK